MENNQISVRNYIGQANQAQTTRLNNKLGKLETKEMKQTANPKTLNKNLSSTKGKRVIIQKTDLEDLQAQFNAFINFLNKKDKSPFMGFDATAIKKVVNASILFNNLGENGLNKANCLADCVGILDKQAKEMIKKQAKEMKQASK
jgi:hypothetical protein